RAAHTLSSNAGTAGFKAIADLAKALEQWLDVHPGSWTSEALTMLDNSLVSLADMLRKAAQLRQPKPATGLLNVLREATARYEAEAEAQGIDVADYLDISFDDISGGEDISAIIQDSKPADAITEVRQAADTSIEIVEEKQPEEKAQAPQQTPPAAQAAAVDQELLTMFLEEARELVPQVGNELRAWRANPTQADHPDALQRALHTLKGSARMAGQADLGDTVHSMEDKVIKALKSKTAIDFDDMFVDLDRIGGLLEEATGGSTGVVRVAQDEALPETAALGRSSD